MPSEGWTKKIKDDKENVAYIHSRILYSLKKDRNPTICNDMDELWRHYARWNKLVIKRQILHDSTLMMYLK